MPGQTNSTHSSKTLALPVTSTSAPGANVEATEVSMGDLWPWEASHLYLSMYWSNWEWAWQS